MILTGALAMASRIASVVSAMARSRSPLARQITARLVKGCGDVGSRRIASLMSASAPARSPSASFDIPRFCQENADGAPALIDASLSVIALAFSLLERQALPW